MVKNLKSSIIKGLLLQIYNLKFSKEKRKNELDVLKFQDFISLKNIKMVIFNKLIILVLAKTKFDAYNVVILKRYDHHYM
jgi:LytS/YehU family sensor histidine kinase